MPERGRHDTAQQVLCAVPMLHHWLLQVLIYACTPIFIYVCQYGIMPVYSYIRIYLCLYIIITVYTSIFHFCFSCSTSLFLRWRHSHHSDLFCRAKLWRPELTASIAAGPLYAAKWCGSLPQLPCNWVFHTTLPHIACLTALYGCHLHGT